MAGTIIGKSIVIDGEISGEEDLVIQGTVRGKVAVKDNLVVESSAVVEADLSASAVVVGGQVTGNVTATDRLELMSEARLVGDVRAARLMFSEGATFKGTLDMDL